MSYALPQPLLPSALVLLLATGCGGEPADEPSTTDYGDDYWLPRAHSYMELFKSPGFLRNWKDRRVDYAVPFREFVDAAIESGAHQSDEARLFR